MMPEPDERGATATKAAGSWRGGRVRVLARLGRNPMLGGLAGGFALQALLPVGNVGVAWLTGAGCAVLAAPLVLLGPGDAPEVGGLPARAQVERWGAAAQFGCAFALAAATTAGIAAGIALAGAIGL